jgi:hypothetical protein
MKSCVFGCMLALLAISCHKDELNRNKPAGILKIKVGLYISVSEVNENLKSTVGTDDFKVVVFNSSDQKVLEFAKASDIPDEIQLETGTYYVTASSDNDLPAAFDNPYYFGKSDLFDITPGGTQTVVVNCELANTVVSVIYSDKVKSGFSDFTTTVASSAGSLIFNKLETRSGYFQPFPLSILATLTWKNPDGTFENKTLTGSIADPKPKRKYEIHVDAAAGAGLSMVMISLDGSAVPVEIVDITDAPDDTEGLVNPGDLLITEIMYDPTSLPDASGEWFEIYNTTNHAINLQNLVIKKNDTEHHVINAGVSLEPHSYQVLSRTETAVSGSKYIYGTGITLNNTGAILALCNFGTDGTDGNVICSVNYGMDGYPAATGASICLNPESLNEQGEALGTSWCVSTSVYSTGDLGTPGLINDNCN